MAGDSQDLIIRVGSYCIPLFMCYASQYILGRVDAARTVMWCPLFFHINACSAIMHALLAVPSLQVSQYCGKAAHLTYWRRMR